MEKVPRSPEGRARGENEVSPKWCNICKELTTPSEQAQHRNMDSWDEAFIFRRVSRCGCSIARCVAGGKQLYICIEHKNILKAEQEKGGK